VSSSCQASTTKADIRLSLLGMLTCTFLRPEAKQEHNQGWHR
jgi:hypothetical protein